MPFDLLKHILSEAPSIKSFVQTTSDFSSDVLMKKLSSQLKRTEVVAKQFETESDSIPAAPNTSTTRATRSGKISYERNVVIHGAYNSSVSYDEFLKIGGAIPYDTRVKIDKDFLNRVATLCDEVATENIHIKCSDGKTVSVGFTNGSNWGGFGFRLQK